MSWMPLSLSFSSLPQESRPLSPTNHYRLSEALLCVGHVGSPKDQDANYQPHLVRSLQFQPGTSS